MAPAECISISIPIPQSLVKPLLLQACHASSGDRRPCCSSERQFSRSGIMLLHEVRISHCEASPRISYLTSQTYSTSLSDERSNTTGH
ncbi:Carboxylesterase [Pseudozyma hubeiensis]|nr:Carboxylesterase [Pseudozyma hubeiensis]